MVKAKVGRGKEEVETREEARQRRGSMARLAGATIQQVGKGEKGFKAQAWGGGGSACGNDGDEVVNKYEWSLLAVLVECYSSMGGKQLASRTSPGFVPPDLLQIN